MHVSAITDEIVHMQFKIVPVVCRGRGFNLQKQLHV